MGFFEKLKQGLSKTKTAVFGQVGQLLKNMRKVDEELMEELEEMLIMADVGAQEADSILTALRDRLKEEKVQGGDRALEILKEILKEMLGEDQPLQLPTRPSVILVIGVNGVGKTTSIAKLTHLLQQQGKRVLLAAADTFRAGAIEQLQVWADRTGTPLVRQSEGADPAAVVFDACAAARKREVDVLLVDTAGRLHNKKNLMEELSKICRVLRRELPDSACETLLVLDSTTGQNAVQQAKEFKNAAALTGLILTKLDGSAKGGVVFSVKKELDVPVKFIGVGEQLDDLQPFSGEDFVNALFEN